ncbi:helix-turn-helix domain-containing protein [Anaerocolumna sedimenticola]|uniref:Helix-turn-helix domain-containing protein n=1 Tax=Anaerocolumna sedimenticola TaxID=2696063 RepID=A0A6P1TKH6_9FIRM|nr:AraC family transcriptional regulator [Anaerocolumna sedimenticola]QHQ60933.1 helix-turn-helix domain-containing protein [Anaerocolumna sedimenticola]
MNNEDKNQITVSLNPWPEFTGASFRNFYQNEKHITRICDFYVLIFMLERSLFFREDGKDIVLNKGEWYIQKPDLLQQGIKGSPAPSYFYIHFNAKEIPDIENVSLNKSQNIANVILPRRGIYDSKFLIPLFHQLDYCYRNKAVHLLNCQSIFLSLLNTITVNNNTEEKSGLGRQITKYISENYNKDINCNCLAKQFHFSTEYINRKVKQYCGQTPGQYLQEIRILRAKELLANTDHTLSYITKETGYHDTTVFYKAFKKQTGISPGNWREESRGMSK